MLRRSWLPPRAAVNSIQEACVPRNKTTRESPKLPAQHKPPRPMFRTIEKPTKSNRKPKFLESRATPTKQTSPHRSNRKKKRTFRDRFQRPRCAPASKSRTPVRTPQLSKIPPNGNKKRTRDPSILFRVQLNPTHCFLTLTTNSK